MMNEEFVTNGMENNEREIFVVMPEEVNNDVVYNEGNGTSGVLLGAAIAGIGCLAYAVGPKIYNGIKTKIGNRSKETLEEKRTRLLKELSEVNEQIVNNDNQSNK